MSDEEIVNPSCEQWREIVERAANIIESDYRTPGVVIAALVVQAAEVQELRDKLARAEAAIESCLRTSNGRETEWGKRGRDAIGFLHEFAMTKGEK